MDSMNAVASFVEQYVDVNESAALELQSRVTDYLNIDMEHRSSIDKAFGHARDLCSRTGSSTVSMDGVTRKRNLRQLSILLMRMQELDDERLRLVEGAQDMIDAKRRCIDASRRRLDAGIVEETVKLSSSKEDDESRDTIENMSEVGSVATSRKSTGRKKELTAKPGPSGTSLNTSKRSGSMSTMSSRQNKVLHNQIRKRRIPGISAKGRRKSDGHSQLDSSEAIIKLDDNPSDPDSPDPLYCLCQQVSFGEMIACDNDSCSIEWFHFSCVNVHSRPKGKWFCPKCRGDSAKLKRPDA